MLRWIYWGVVPLLLLGFQGVVYAAPTLSQLQSQPAPSHANDVEKALEKSKRLDQPERGNVQPSVVDNVEVDASAVGHGESKVKKGLSFRLVSVNVKGNQTLKSEDVIGIVKPFVGKMISGRDLKIIAERITALFVDQGYVTSKCVIPAQQVKNGVVTFQIIENKLGQIMLSGEQAYRYDQSLFTRYLHDLQGKIININELNQRMRLLTTLPSARVKPILVRASAEVTNLMLQLDHLRDTNSISFTNAGSRYTSENVVSFSSALHNFSGHGDNLTLGGTLGLKQFQFTNAFNAGYIIPYGESGGNFGISAKVLNYRLDPSVFAPAVANTIRYQGSSNAMRIQYDQPILLESGNLWWGLGFERNVTTADTVLQTNFIQSAGTKIVEGVDKLVVVDAHLRGSIVDSLFGQKYRGVNSLSFAVRHALAGVLGGMSNDDIVLKQETLILTNTRGPIGDVRGMDPKFWKFYLDLSHYQPLPYNLKLSLSAHGEYSQSKKLPQAYQFTGADNGSTGWSYNASLGWQPVSNAVLTLGYSQVTAVSYYRDIAPVCAGQANSIGRNKCSTGSFYGSLSLNYQGAFISTSFSPTVKSFQQNLNKFRFNAGYSW